MARTKNNDQATYYGELILPTSARLTKDPVQISGENAKTTSVGINVAVNSQQYNDRDGETYKSARFYNLIVFGANAEIALEKLSKGDTITFHGRVRAGKPYENKNGDLVETDQVVVDGISIPLFALDWLGSNSDDDEDESPRSSRRSRRSQDDEDESPRSRRSSSRSRRSRQEDLDDEDLNIEFDDEDDDDEDFEPKKTSRRSSRKKKTTRASADVDDDVEDYVSGDLF